MEDYKTLYLKLFAATENAMDILIAAQQECEELLLRQSVQQMEIVSPAPDPWDKPRDG